MVESSALGAEQVTMIRKRLGKSRQELAAALDVSIETVKAWEDGRNPCKGPARVLLELLDASPRVLDLAQEWDGLPRPDAIEGSREWFKLQRLLGIIGDHGMDYGYWSDVQVEEQLTEEYLWDLERHGFLSRNSRNPTIRRYTPGAYARFKLDAWEKFRAYGRYKNTQDIPLMTPDLLEKYGRGR